MDQDILRWSVEHSDPEELRKRAEAVRNGTSQPLSSIDAKVVDILMPNDFNMMEKLISDAENKEFEEEKRVAALEGLEFLCEIADNAKGMHKFDGVFRLFQMLTDENSSRALREGVCSVFQVSMVNNGHVQQEVMEANGFDIFGKLMQESQKEISLLIRVISCVSALCSGNEETSRKCAESGVLRLVANEVLVFSKREESASMKEKLLRRIVFALWNVAGFLKNEFVSEIEKVEDGSEFLDSLLRAGRNSESVRNECRSIALICTTHSPKLRELMKTSSQASL